MSFPEKLLYGGESPENRHAFNRYLEEVNRGKSLLQLQAVAAQITLHIRSCWSARSFTPIITSDGEFDEIICNISYHFHKHGQHRYPDIKSMTEDSVNYFRANRHLARTEGDLLRFPDRSLYELDGRIVTRICR